MDLGQWIVIGLSVVMGVWYLVGATINRRRGVATYYWLRSGLEVLGQVSEARWIGSSGSGARLVVGQAARPFRRLEVVFLLESREILPLWLFNRLRDKQDEMILKATLRKAPVQEIEIARPGDRIMQDTLTSERGHAYESRVGPAGFQLLRRKMVAAQDSDPVDAFVEQNQAALLRLSLQPQVPHLIVRLNLPPLRENTGEAFFSGLSALFSQGSEKGAVNDIPGDGAPAGPPESPPGGTSR